MPMLSVWNCSAKKRWWRLSFQVPRWLHKLSEFSDKWITQWAKGQIFQRKQSGITVNPIIFGNLSRMIEAQTSVRNCLRCSGQVRPPRASINLISHLSLAEVFSISSSVKIAIFFTSREANCQILALLLNYKFLTRTLIMGSLFLIHTPFQNYV